MKYHIGKLITLKSLLEETTYNDLILNIFFYTSKNANVTTIRKIFDKHNINIPEFDIQSGIALNGDVLRLQIRYIDQRKLPQVQKLSKELTLIKNINRIEIYKEQNMKNFELYKNGKYIKGKI